MKAFPTHREEGMDLRDYFAAKAMQAFIHLTMNSIATGDLGIENICGAAYGCADAMMEARKQHD